MRVVKFQAAHLDALDPQDAQASVVAGLRGDKAKALEGNCTFTCVDNDEVYCVFGWIVIYPHRAVMWSLLSKNAGPKMLALTRIARGLLKDLSFKRLEIDVALDFEAGNRWAKLMGFELEAACLRNFSFDNKDSALYVRIK